MPIPVEEIIGSVPVWPLVLGTIFAVIFGGSYSVYYAIWRYLPRKWKWIVRGEEGFCYPVLDGDEVDDPETKNAEGPAAGRRTSGGFRYHLLVYKEHCLDEKTGDIILGKSDNGIFGKGIYLIGFLFAVVEIARERWAEVKEGEYRERTVVRRGFSVQVTSMAYKVSVLDRDNFLFHLVGTVIWSICNPDKAKRLTRDVQQIVIDLIRGEWIRWAKKRKIYRPTVNLSDIMGDKDTDENPEKIGPEKQGEEDETKSDGSDYDALADEFWGDLTTKVFKYRPLIVKGTQQTSPISWIPFYRKITFSYEEGSEKSGSFKDMVKGVYGIDIDRMILHEVAPDKAFAEALSAPVKSRLEGIARLIDAAFNKKATFQDLEAEIKVGAAIDQSRGVLAGKIAKALEENMPKMLLDTRFLVPFISEIAPKVPIAEVHSFAESVVEKAKEKKEAESGTNMPI